MLTDQLLDPCILAVGRGYHVMLSGSKHILCPMRQKPITLEGGLLMAL